MNIDWKHGSVAPGVPVVPELPQSSWCLVPAEALMRIAPLLAGNTAFDRCRIIDLHLASGRFLDVGYELSNGTAAAVVATIRFAPRGESALQFRKARAKSATPTAVRHLQQLDAVAWIFPEDPDLPHLAWISNARCVPLALADAAGQDWPSMGWQAMVLSYRLGDRCAMRYSVPRTGYAVVAKMQAQGQVSQTHAAMLALRQVPDRAFEMPQPLACDASRDLRWESFVPGARFEQLGADDLDASLEALVAGLASLHRAKVEGLSRQDPAGMLQRLKSVALKRIDRAGLAAGELCREVARHLAARVPPVAQHGATLHGDLHTGNVLFSRGTVAFIDLDSMVLGDPSFDLAMLASRLALLALIEPDRSAELMRQAALLAPRYRQCGGYPIEDRVLAWYMAATLVGRQVKTCINHAAPALDEKSQALARMALSIIESGSIDAARLAADALSHNSD